MHPISFLCHLVAATSPKTPTTTMNDPMTMTVTSLHRYAVKGLSGDALDHVSLKVGDTFPDDRRYALLLEQKKDDWEEGKWLHKENFLCAFSDPEFLAQFQSKYEVVQEAVEPTTRNPADDALTTTTTNPQRLLTVTRRSTGERLLDRIDLQDAAQRHELAD